MSRFFSITNLITSLLDAGTREGLTYSGPGPENGGVTLRFEPELLHFLDSQARSLGCTRSTVVSMILTGVMRQSKGDIAGGDLIQSANTAVERVQLLLQMHGLDVVGAVELLTPFGVTMNVMRSKEALSDHIPHMMDFLEATFLVSREWLVGETDIPTGVTGKWYKDLHNFCYHVAQLAEAGLSPEVIFLRSQNANLELAYADKNDLRAAQDITPIVKITRTLPSGQKFDVYEQWKTERWNYHNCRLYLKLMMLWCLRAKSSLGVRSSGCQLRPESFEALRSHRILPVQAMKGRSLGGAWFIDDYVMKWDHGKEQDELPLLEKTYQEKLAKYFDDLNWKMPEHTKGQTYEFKVIGNLEAAD